MWGNAAGCCYKCGWQESDQGKGITEEEGRKGRGNGEGPEGAGKRGDIV